ncbi:MAG: hypothetical protein GY918_07120 [Gammaproteobacteria bacterium]|nr:hypothetical protein [Gammaproteobacteria bacterium]
MTIYYVGDLHADIDAIKRIDKACTGGVVVQVGDLGIGFENPCPIINYFVNTDGPQWFTCGGNHDNWDWYDGIHPPLCTGSFGRLEWVRRGSIVDIEDQSHLFFGGAESVDKHHRISGKSWWCREVPSYIETTHFAAALFDCVDIVVAHDAPARVVDQMSTHHYTPSPFRHDLQCIFNSLNPKEHPKAWYFGHHHPVDYDVQTPGNDTNTNFVCLGIETINIPQITIGAK